MGYCKIGSSTEPCSQSECSEFGGSYFDKPGDHPGGCFLLSVLGDERAILMAGTMMYPAMIQFRDEILRRTPLGRKLILYFDEFYEEAKAIARKDPKLVTDIVWLSVYVSPFLQSMLGARPVAESTIETPLSRLASEYRPSTHEVYRSVVARFKKQASKRFAAALDDSERIFGRFVGLGPTEALRELRRAELPPKPVRRKKPTGS